MIDNNSNGDFNVIGLQMLLAVGFFFQVIENNQNSKIENQKSHGSIWQEINVNCDLALLMAFL